MAITPQNTDLYIDKITTPGGTEYPIVDMLARQTIDSMASYTTFLGVVSTATPITDGSTATAIKIGSNVNTITAVPGNIVIQLTDSPTAGRIAQEYIYTDSTHGWQLFGDISADNLGDLAYKNDASTVYTPAGTIETTTATLSSKGKYTPKGTITLYTTATPITLSATAGEITGSATANYLIYKPTGTVTVTNTPSASTTAAEVLSSIEGNILVSSVTASEPSGTTPTNGVNYTSVTGHCLYLWYLTQSTTGAISSTSTVSVIKGVNVTNTTTASFTGDDYFIAHPSIDMPVSTTFAGTQATLTVTGSVISDITFTGTTATITVS